MSPYLAQCKKAVLIIPVWSYASVISLYWSQLKVSNHCCQNLSRVTSLLWLCRVLKFGTRDWVKSKSFYSSPQLCTMNLKDLETLMSSITLWLWRYGLDGRSAAQRSRWVGSHPSPPALSPEYHHKPRNNRSGWRALWSRSESQSCRASTASPA